MTTSKTVIVTIVLLMLTLVVIYMCHKLWTITGKVTQDLTCEETVWIRGAALLAALTIIEMTVGAWHIAFVPEKETATDTTESKTEE